MFTSAVDHRHGSERAWTEHLATADGARALLDAVRCAPLPDPLLATLDEICDALASGRALQITHQLHLGGRYPDLAISDVRDRLFAIVEAQRRCADDLHIAKLAAHYLPTSGARLGILVAEAWRPRLAGHPAWAPCPAPVVVVTALDALHEPEYRPAWVHHPAHPDDGCVRELCLTQFAQVSGAGWRRCARSRRGSRRGRRRRPGR